MRNISRWKRETPVLKQTYAGVELKEHPSDTPRSSAMLKPVETWKASCIKWAFASVSRRHCIRYAKATSFQSNIPSRS